MAIVKYPEYINADAERIRTNNAMMGLLVGSKLASRTLESTGDSNFRLSELFSDVEHVHRFDLRPDKAREILNESESLLGSMAVLYVFGLHEDLMRDMLAMLSGEPSITSFDAGAINSNKLHIKFSQVSGKAFDAELLEIFNVIRLMRNARIHNGGVAKPGLAQASSNLSQKAKDLWQAITGKPALSYSAGTEVKLELNELILVLAITKRLAEAANVILQQTLSRATWLKVFEAHFLLEVNAVGNPNQLLRKSSGFAKQYYSPLKFEQSELEGLF